MALRVLFVRYRGYRPTVFTAEEWDDQFSRGCWGYLHDLDELSHHSIIAGYFSRITNEKEILDVGCGAGILASLLPNVAHYVGIDISEAAIIRARSLSIPAASFLVADAETFEPSRKFDMIVFNESLYYFKNPIQLIYRLSSALKPAGVIVISMYHHANTINLWRSISKAFPSVDEVIVFCFPLNRLST
jgi:SAM-dependent methyltransferase